MNEVEKMMQNANVKKKWNSTPYGGIEEYYPPFTAEKQIELIKFLIKDYNYYLDVIDTNNFENSLAASLNDLWQYLTDEEHKQIKEILE